MSLSTNALSISSSVLAGQLQAHASPVHHLEHIMLKGGERAYLQLDCGLIAANSGGEESIRRGRLGGGSTQRVYLGTLLPT